MEDRPTTLQRHHRVTARRAKLLAVGLSAALAAGGAAVALTGPAGAYGRTAALALAPTQEETVLGTYRNDQATITVTKSVTGTGDDTVVAFIADVTLTDVTALRAAFAGEPLDAGSRSSITAMSRNNNAVLGFNSDFASYRDDGIVIRNGTVYRDIGARHGLGIRRDGSFLLYDETQTSAEELLADDVWQTQSFGPHLLRDGELAEGIDTYEIGDFGEVEPGGPGSIQGLNPRTGIGMIAPNHFLVIVVDGRGANGSRGVTLPEFAEIFRDAGAVDAFNLDGGASSTMYFDDAVVNAPSGGSERLTSDMLFIGR